MSEFKPSEDLTQYLNEWGIMSYRLVDGSYVIAEEVDHDEENNILYIAGALELNTDINTGKGYFKPWLDSEDDELIQLVGDKILARSETPLKYKSHYHKYYLLQQVKINLSEEEIDDVLNQISNPLVDNLDYSEGDDGYDEDWGMGFNQPLSDIHKEWRSKFKDN
jgi:hypothetical protein